MGFHHVAITTQDCSATHRFYTESTGFELVKVEVGPSGESGFAKHLFYDTGDGTMMAVWELHDDSLPENWSTGIATGLGLPIWTNHIAFLARDVADLEARRERWLAHGVSVMEVDHGWCHSIYANDPNGVMVEFCTSTRELTAEDREEALALLHDPAPRVKEMPTPIFHRSKEKS
ncbi:MAG: VOC family protein [Myxococcota bacterium]